MECQKNKIGPIYGTEKEDLFHNAVVYSYPCGYADILCSTAPDFRPEGWEERGQKRTAPAPRKKGVSSDGEDLLRSIRRAKARVRRLALANDFRWFVTLTLDQQMVDRYDPKEVQKKLRTWLDNNVRRRGLAYILVPEHHKDGAIHFHGFFNDALEAVDSGHKDSCGHPVYNLPRWALGFSTAIELYGEYGSAVAYVCKYIGKQGGERFMGRWYFSGGALAEPEKTYVDLDYRGLQEDFPGQFVELPLPGKSLLVIHTTKEEMVYGKKGSM